MADLLQPGSIAGGAPSGGTTVSGNPLDWSSLRVASRLWLPCIAFASVALCLPFIRCVFSLGDEGVLLLGAQRMLRGDRLYTDFFEFLPPGGFVLTEIWLRLAGSSILAMRSLAILNIGAIASLMFLASRKASGNAPLSAFVAIGWVVMSQGLWTELSHHWLTTMFSLVTVWAVLADAEPAKPSWRWPLLGGAASGAASMITPTCGALAMLAALTAFLPLRRRGGALLVYILAGALVPLGLVLYLIWHHSLADAFNDVIVFAASQYAPMQAVPYGTWANPQNAPLRYFFAAAVGLALVVGVRDWRGLRRDRVFWRCVAFCVAGFVASFPRPDVYHIAFEVPLAAPLFVCCASRLIESWRPAWRYTAMGVLAMLVMPSANAFSRAAAFVSRSEIAPTARGAAAFIGLDGAPEMLARIAALPEADGFLFYPFMPMLPYLAGRDHVAKYDVLTPGYSLPSQYRDACESTIPHAAWVVIDLTWTDPATLRHVFPALRDTQPHETVAFEQALTRGFDLVAREGMFELRHRRDDATVGICNEIAAAGH